MINTKQKILVIIITCVGSYSCKIPCSDYFTGGYFQTEFVQLQDYPDSLKVSVGEQIIFSPLDYVQIYATYRTDVEHCERDDEIYKPNMSFSPSNYQLYTRTYLNNNNQVELTGKSPGIDTATVRYEWWDDYPGGSHLNIESFEIIIEVVQ